ncbi:MAG TPA: 6-phosphogluconolactonase [Acidimicrobiales bacterium]|nr:6-phosphogluconolactonase [Acidimicrobiales bacterium]
MSEAGEKLASVPAGELQVVDDVPAAFTALVEQVAGAAIARSGRCRIALSGGATARACYERLARSTEVDWVRLECFLGDERCVPAGDEDANQRLVREALVDRVPVGEFHPMDCERPAAYAARIEEALPLDLVHLGLGPDGHTASLFPGSPGLEAPVGTLVIRTADPSGRNPHERLSLTLGAIARCEVAVFTVSGEAKHDALHRVLAGEDLPASRVRAGRVLWLCDRDALGEDLGRVR